MASLVSCGVHERRRPRMMRALMEPTFDSAYAQLSVSRVQAAAEFLWQKVSAQCARGLRAAGPDTDPPSDGALLAILQSFEFEIKLAPLPAPAGSRTGGAAASTVGHDADNGAWALARPRRGTRGKAKQARALEDAPPVYVPPAPPAPCPIADGGKGKGNKGGGGKGKG